MSHPQLPTASVLVASCNLKWTGQLYQNMIQGPQTPYLDLQIISSLKLTHAKNISGKNVVFSVLT